MAQQGNIGVTTENIFPVGHHSRLNLPMVEGCRVRLRVGEEGTTLEFLP